MRSFTVLVNPISGRRRAPQRAKPVVDLLRAAGASVDVVVTEGPGHAIAAARDAARDGRVVVAAGGDGLVRDVAHGITYGTMPSTADGTADDTADDTAQANGVLGIIPAGRGNDLARRLGLPTTPSGLAELFLNGRARPVDVLECAGTVIPGNLYAGIDSTANTMINAWRWIPPSVVYRVVPLAVAVRWRSADYRITVDGTEIDQPAHTVVVANSGGYGRGLDIVPSAVTDDGLLDVLVAGAVPRWMLAFLMRRARHGRHVEHPQMTVLRGSEVTIAADRRVPVCADGDYLCDLPVTVRLVPERLQVLRP